nr:hypothetical protein BHE74_00017168 [Ipomoea batatas]
MSRESMEEDPSSKLAAYGMISSGRIEGSRVPDPNHPSTSCEQQGFAELQKVCAACSLREASCALRSKWKKVGEVRNLLLQSKDVRNAAINGILKPGLSFIGDGNGGVGAVFDGEMREQLRSITGTKNLMDGFKMGSS